MAKTILFLIDSWSSTAGGIQTVNRELCLAVAAYCKDSIHHPFDVVCICKDCSQAEQKDAIRCGVNLLKADIEESTQEIGADDRILANLFHSSMENTDVICVVGHAKFTGQAAIKVRNRHFPHAKVVTTYQMDIDETEEFKKEIEALPTSEYSEFLRKWDERRKLECTIASLADIVFAIGPRLERSIKDALNARRKDSEKVRSLLCGIWENVEPRKQPPEVPTFVFIGRVEHPKLKGVDLFVKAAGEVVRRWEREWQHQDQDIHEPKFIIRGLPSDPTKAMPIIQELKALAKSAAGQEFLIIWKPYDSDESNLVEDILSASAVVMPSRAEGFGLVAFEAVSYGVPIVVAKQSGVAEVLENYCGKEGYTPKFIVNTRLQEDDAVEHLADALAFFVWRPESGRNLARNLRNELIKHCSWSAAANSFMEAVGVIAAPPFVHSKSEEIADIREFLWKEVGYVDDVCLGTSKRRLDEIFVNRDFEEWEPRVMEKSDDELEALRVALPKSRQKGKRKKWSDVTEGLGAAVILGDPGSGKTASLLREVQQKCLAAVNNLDSGALSLEGITFAAYFHASQLGRKLGKEDGSVIENAIDLLCERHGPISDDCRAWLRDKFKRGQILLVVDALDEMPRERVEELDVDSKMVLEERLSALRRGATPCPMLLSSRSFGYTSPSVPGAVQWQLLPFTPGQERLAARKWLSGYPEAIENFTDRVTHTPPLAELLTNPLLLMLACQVWEAALEENEPLPTFNRRCDLYQQCISRLRGRWVERMQLKGREPNLSEREAFVPFVEAVAWELWHRDPGRSFFPGSEIGMVVEEVPKLRALEGRSDLFEDICESGILTKAGPREVEAPYLFLHRTLLEFLAASHVSRSSADLTVRLDPVREVRAYFGDPNAHVMLWMLVGKLKNPGPLFKEIIAWAERQLELPRENSPVEGSPVLAELLVDCLFECGGSTVDKETLERAWELITRGLDRQQRSRRKHGGEWVALVDWGLIYRAMKAVEIHEGPTSHAKEVLELVEDLQHTPLLKGRILPAEAVRDFDERLRAGFRSECSVVRWAAIWATAALATKGREEVRLAFGPLIVEKLGQDPSPHVRCTTARVLAEMYHPDTLALLGSVLDGECRMAAVGAALGLSRLMTHESISGLKRKADSMLGEPSTRSRDPLLVAVIGALEWVVHRVSDSKGHSTFKGLLKDEAFANIFLRALRSSFPLIRGTAASALGKMRWTAAWESLKELVEIPDDGAADTQRMRESACYACDQLTAVIEEAKLEGAGRCFRRCLEERREALGVRRSAASGMMKLLQRGYRSERLVNTLLQAAQDPDIIVAKNSMLALFQLKPEEIIDDATLLLGTFGEEQRKVVCDAAWRQPTRTGILLIQWLLNNDATPDVLVSALFAVGKAYYNIRNSPLLPQRDDLREVDLLRNLARRAIDLSWHEAWRVVSGSLCVFQEIGKWGPFRTGNALFPLREEMVVRTRTLFEQRDSNVQESACFTLGALGTQEDVPKLRMLLTDPSIPGKVRKAAKTALDFLERWLSRGQKSMRVC